MPDKDTGNDKLLKKIRQRYAYGMEKWRRNREEGQKNIRYVSGDPWDDVDKQARKDRPTVCPDELNQYVNQVVNTARQNPRGIQVDPAGDDATEELAEYRENRIRAIEYACNAARAYVNGLQGAVERNVGYWKVTRAYISDKSKEQEILILPIMNGDSILIDPDYKELDGSDIGWAFELDRMPQDEFEDEFPDRQVRSFAADDFGGEDHAKWYDGKSLLVASYWDATVDRTSKVGNRVVKQYITNGFEILKAAKPQPGPYIPIIPVFGKELWVDYGGGAERVLLSLVSLARDPQKALAYVMSSMLENIGQMPKASVVGYVGQFETDAEAWESLNTQYHPILQADPIVDGASGAVLPLPGRMQNVPDFQAYSIGADICRRAIMSAMGISPLPTAAQRSNQKSGTALEKIQSQQAVGSYHLIDAYESAIKLTGRIVNRWLSETDLGESTRPVRKADGTHKLLKVNTDAPVMDGDHEYHIPIADDQGRYQVTVSTSPSTESQRSEASDFAETLVGNLQNLPQPGTPAAKILSLVIRLKQLGPIGDQISDVLSPQDNGQQQQQMAQMQQQAAQQQEQMGKMQEMLQKLMLEKAGQVIQGQNKLQVTKMQEATKLAVAEITASQDANESMADRENETYQLMHGSAHDLAMQAHQQAHQQGMAQQAAQQQSQLADQQAQNKLAMQKDAQAHQQGMAQQAAQNTSAQSAQDAAQGQAAAEAQPE